MRTWPLAPQQPWTGSSWDTDGTAIDGQEHGEELIWMEGIQVLTCAPVFTHFQGF